MKRRILFLILFLILISCLTVTSFGASQGVITKKKIVKIGLFGPLTGLFQKIGECVVDGMKAYIDQLNSKGGLGGYKFELIAYDNNMDPILTKQVLEKLIKQDRVFALVGCMGSIGVNAVLKDLVDYGIPVVYMAGGEYHWAVPPKRNIFPVQPDYITEGYLMVKFAIQNLNAKKIAFIYRDDDGTGPTYLKGADRAMEKIGNRIGVKMVLKMRRIALDVVIAKLKDAKPDVTVISDFYGNAAGLVSGATRVGIQTKWVSSYVNGDDIMYKMCGKAWLGVYVGGWAKDKGPNLENFIKYFMTTGYHRKALSNRWTSPSGFHVAGWIACEIFFGGLNIFYKKYKNIDLLDWDKFIDSMEQMRNFNDTIAKDITYLPMSMAKKGTRYYSHARRGQLSMYFTVASLSLKKEFYLKPVTGWLSMD